MVTLTVTAGGRESRSCSITQCFFNASVYISQAKANHMAAIPFHGAGTRSEGELEPMDSLVAPVSLVSTHGSEAFTSLFVVQLVA